jgi:TRAP-type C4-dicarboxylate transport system substrate-binding protein
LKKILLTALFIIAFTFNAQGATIIKMGSLAPVNSPWDIHLKKMAAEWKKATDGKVILKIYSGGIMGDEDDMLRKMQLGQLQAAAITGVGITRIYPQFITFHVPLLMESFGECRYVLDRMGDQFNQEIEAKGFKVLAWSVASWAHYFSREPVVTPADLKKQKLWVWRGDDDGITTYRKNGFQPLALGIMDIMPGLSTGMVDAYLADPISTTANQWYTVADNMCALPWAPITGGVLISKRAWDRIPEELRPKIEAASRSMEAPLQADIIAANEQAIDTMKQQGLSVNKVTAEAKQTWQALVDTALSDFMGDGFDPAILSDVKTYVAEYRSKNGE